MHAASSSPGRVTTSARRSRRMRALIEAAEDGLIEPDEYLPTLREQATTLTVLVDDLFELAQIDAGALTLELRRRASPRSSPRAASPRA